VELLQLSNNSFVSAQLVVNMCEIAVASRQLHFQLRDNQNRLGGRCPIAISQRHPFSSQPVAYLSATYLNAGRKMIDCTIEFTQLSIEYCDSIVQGWIIRCLLDLLIQLLHCFCNWADASDSSFAEVIA